MNSTQSTIGMTRSLARNANLKFLGASLGALATGVSTLLLAGLGTAAQAQTTTTSNPPPATNRAAASNDSYSILPYTRKGYVGINLGKPDYRGACSAGGIGCENPNVMGKIYTGGMFNDYAGVELGYVHMGRAERAGSRSDAQGLNLSLLGRVPFGSSFSGFAKVGATYGRTHLGAAPPFRFAEASESGWGRSYGAGLGFDVSRQSTIVLEWERHQFRFADIGRHDVDATSIGYQHRF